MFLPSYKPGMVLVLTLTGNKEKTHYFFKVIECVVDEKFSIKVIRLPTPPLKIEMDLVTKAEIYTLVRPNLNVRKTREKIEWMYWKKKVGCFCTEIEYNSIKQEGNIKIKTKIYNPRKSYVNRQLS
jgi:hypothetical protein